MTSDRADPTVIVSFARTPMGGFQGAFSAVSASELGSCAVKAAVERSKIDTALIDEIIMGCVLSAGLGQAPARQAALGAGMPKSVRASTINKMCGSGMQAVIMADQALQAGSADVVIAGGMESMTNAPYLSKRHRKGMRIGHDALQDHMFLDGLEDAYEPGRLMGAFAEDVAANYQFSRRDMDQYAILSLERARAAIEKGSFVREIAPVELKTSGGVVKVDTDEQPSKANLSKIPQLKPAFAENGAITAANSSSISDGAAALVVTRQSVAKRHGLNVIARIVSHAAHAHEPRLFATAPVPAMQKALERANWTAKDVDLFEVNEAFAVVAMIAERDLAIDRQKLNVNGGACALGHPIGASGARVLATLLAGLESRGGTKGLASLCIGGGEATAMAIELA